MKLSKERIGFLAKAVVDGILKGRLVDPAEKKREGLLRKIEGIIFEELMVEDRLNAEVEEILNSHYKEIEKGEVDQRKMFQMVKNQLARERGIVL